MMEDSKNCLSERLYSKSSNFYMDKLNKSNCSTDTTSSSFYLPKKKSVNFYPMVDIHFIQSYKVFNKYGVYDYEKKYEQRQREIFKKRNTEYYGENCIGKCCNCNIF